MTKKAIITTHDGREASPITKASNVLFENGQTAQDILNDRQDAMISPVIENSSSMFKVGQGDNVDYSANVVNGAYESMVLKGKSMVNCIQEPSSKDVVLPYEFIEGQYVTINDTKESGALGVELKGQTLVNVINRFWFPNSANHYFYVNLKQYEIGKDYLFMIFNAPQEITEVYFGNDASTIVWRGYTSDFVRNGSTISLKVTCPSNYDGSEILPHIRYGGADLPLDVLKQQAKAMLIPYQEGMENWDIPYFTGMTSCKMPTLHTVGKNLFNGKLEDGSLNENTGDVESSTSFKRTVNFIRINPNKEYRMRANGTVNGRVYFYDINKSYISTQLNESRLVVPSNAKYLKFRIGTDVLSDGQEIQLEESSATTPYEAHKSSILSLPEEVVLRSLPNGVCDTFNTRTGVYTQRIYETTLVGTEEWYLYDTSNANRQDTIAFSIDLGLGDVFDNEETYSKLGGIVCDKLNHINSVWGTNKDIEGISADQRNVIVQIKKTRLASEDVAGFKTWLTSNNLKVGIQLKVPTITKINLPSTLKSWNTTTHIYSEIPENSLYPILSHSNPTYPVILKPSTKYSIVANSYSNSHTNSAINFNLGGTTASTTVGNRVTTVTTPSTLSNELLTMSGRGNKLNNVMVIEGDVVGDEPYFEGICDCKSPILSNVGKNLFPSLLEYDALEMKTEGSSYELTDTKITWNSSNNYSPSVGYYFNLKPNTEYVISYEQGGNPEVMMFNRHSVKYDAQCVIKTSSLSSENGRVGLAFISPSDGKFSIRLAPIRNNSGAWIANVCLTEAKSLLPMLYEPYKSNILSANGDKIELTEDMFEQGAIAQYINSQNIGKTYQWMKDNSDSNYDKRRLRLKNLVKVKPNTKLILQNTDNFMYAMSGFDSNKLSLGTFDTSWIQNAKVTIPQDVHYISLFIRKKDDTEITINDFKNAKFTLSEVDKTIVLRSLPNGVCDTLNVETGEYVQRIGEINISDLSKMDNMVRKGGWDNGTYMSFDIIAPDAVQNKTNVITTASNLFPTVVRNLESSESMKEFVTNTASGNLFVMMRKDRLLSADLNGFKQWLEDNDLVIQYELATPVVKTVDLSGYPFSYENGHVVLSSGSIEQSLTPKVEYSVATNRNGQIRSNQKMVEKHQKELDKLQAVILANLINSQYQQTLTTLKYELSRV